MSGYDGKTLERAKNVAKVAADWTMVEDANIINKKPGFRYKLSHKTKIDKRKFEGWEDAGDAGEKLLKGSGAVGDKDAGIWLGNLKLLRIPNKLYEARCAHLELKTMQQEAAAQRLPRVPGTEKVTGQKGSIAKVAKETISVGKK